MAGNCYNFGKIIALLEEMLEEKGILVSMGFNVKEACKGPLSGEIRVVI